MAIYKYPKVGKMVATITSDLAEYLQSIGGKDVLRFPSAEAASAAAHHLRASFPDVDVRASYDRVELRAIECA